jgi:predicted Zn-dependent protease
MRIHSFVRPPWLLVLVLTAACATNPATGKRELMLVSEQQEAALGKQAATEVPGAYGIYQDAALQSYVRSVGEQLARASERPQLEWTFDVVDDASVNAFALPGGHVYVTRGLLAELESEAELAMVMGHEVGHVAARHSANQISKQQLASVGFLAGMIAVPELQRFGQLGQTALGLMFLKFSRDDEREADTLGLRYSGRLGYEPEQAAQAMQMLDLVSRQSNEGRMPSWLSTHPDPGDRYHALVTQIQQQHLSGEKVNREAYLRRLDGLMYGDDPREGFFREDTFYHPGLRFRMQLPRGFKTQNTKQAVIAASPQGDAVVQLTMAQGRSAEEAARALFSQVNAQPNLQRTELNGLPAVAGTFQAAAGQTMVGGVAAFVEMDGRVYQILGYTPANEWSRYGRLLEASVESFAPLRERWAFEVEPKRLRLVTVNQTLSVDEFARRYPSTVPVSTVALLNQLEPGGTLKAGQLAKQVIGGSAAEGRARLQ